MNLRTSHIPKILVAMTLLVIVAIQPLQAQDKDPDSPSQLLLTNDQEQYPLGPQMEIIEDSEKQWTIEEVASPEFAARFELSADEIPSIGYNDSAYWIRLRLRNQSDWSEWWLQHTRPDVRYIDLYIPNSDNIGFRSIKTGALMPFETRDIPALSYVFQLSIPPQSTQTVYLRYQHNLPTDLSLQLWTPRAYVGNSQLELLAWGTMFSLMIFLIVIALYLSFQLRSKTLLYGGITLIFLMVNNAILNGFIQKYVISDLGRWFVILENVTGVIILIALLKFVSSFLQTARYYPNWDKFINGAIVLCLIILIQIPFVDDSIVGQQLTVVWIISLAALLILGIHVGSRSSTRARYFVAGGLIIIILSGWSILIRSGLGASIGLTETTDIYRPLVIIITIALITASQLANALLKQKSLAEDLRATNESLEQRIVDRTRELSALYDVTSVASKSLDMATAMSLSLERVVDAVRGDAGAVHLIDESGEVLQLAINQDLPISNNIQLESLLVGNGVAGRVMQHGEILVIPDITTAQRSSMSDAVQETFEAFVGAPIQAGGSVLGVLSIARKKGKPLFSLEEVALLGSIADQVGVVVESARLRGQSEQVAIMEERTRLSRDLHDSVTQLLYSINLFADVGQDAYRSGNLKQVNNSLTELGGIARKALREMRLFVYELRPPILERDGLALALRKRLENVEERANTETHLLVETDVDFTTDEEEVLFQVATEALNNILKHTEATQVRVRIYSDQDLTEMEISDNGKGFDIEENDAGGMGLVGMKERVEKLGGELKILATSGEGTKVHVTLKGRDDYG